MAPKTLNLEDIAFYSLFKINFLEQEINKDTPLISQYLEVVLNFIAHTLIITTDLIKYSKLSSRVTFYVELRASKSTDATCSALIRSMTSANCYRHVRLL